MADSWWIDADSAAFTTRCWVEWEARLQYDRRFGQEEVAGKREITASMEDRRLQSMTWREQQAEADAA